MSTTPPNDLPDVDPDFDFPDSLDALAWAEAFSKADPGGEMDMDGVATWFAAAMMKGQEHPDDEVQQDY